MIEIILILSSYLIGSIAASIILCHLFKLPDPRTQGSGNAGATNVLRIGGKKVAFLTLLIDVLKGVIPVLIAKLYFNLSAEVVGWVALASFLGHLYPIYFKFQGGKGVATALGVTMAMNVGVGLSVFGTWIVIALLFRISSLASLCAALALTISVYLIDQGYLIPSLAMTVLMFWKHRSNISRLLKGNEPKIGKKAKA